MYEWINECMIEWMNDGVTLSFTSMHEWMNEWMNDGVTLSFSSIHEWMNEWMNDVTLSFTSIQGILGSFIHQVSTKW